MATNVVKMRMAVSKLSRAKETAQQAAADARAAAQESVRAGEFEMAGAYADTAVRESEAALDMQRSAAQIESFIPELERAVQFKTTSAAMGELARDIGSFADGAGVAEFPARMKQLSGALNRIKAGAGALAGAADAASGAEARAPKVQALLDQLARLEGVDHVFAAAPPPVRAPAAAAAPAQEEEDELAARWAKLQ